MAKEGGLYKALVGGAHDDNDQNSASTEADNSGTSKQTNGLSIETTYKDFVGRVKKDEEEVGKAENDDDTQSTVTGDLNQAEDKQIEEDFKKAVDKKRLKSYSSPEQCYFFCGLVACFCTGLTWPICGVLVRDAIPANA